MFTLVLLSVLVGEVRESQTIRNICERERFYVRISLPSGYRTTIPVINGYLPRITEFSYCNETHLLLDYGAGSRVPYKSQLGAIIGYCECPKSIERSVFPEKGLPRPEPYGERVDIKPSSDKLVPVRRPPRVEQPASPPVSVEPEPIKAEPPKVDLPPKEEDPLQRWLRSPAEVGYHASL